MADPPGPGPTLLLGVRGGRLRPGAARKGGSRESRHSDPRLEAAFGEPATGWRLHPVSRVRTQGNGRRPLAGGRPAASSLTSRSPSVPARRRGQPARPDRPWPLGAGHPRQRRLCPPPALLTRVRFLGETDAAHNKQIDASAIEGAGQRRPLSPRMAVLPSSSEKQGYPSADRNRVTNSNMGAVRIDDRKTW